METGGCVLLIDDDRDIVRGVSLRLRNAGYEVLTAHDGAGGLKLAIDRAPDAIVLDMRMPIMDGMAVLAHLRDSARTRAIPIVVLSASVLSRNEIRGMGGGVRYFLEKPYNAGQLLEVVEAVTDKAERPCELSEGEK